MKNLVLITSLVLGLSACGPGPLSTGTIIESNSTVQSTSRSFKVIHGDEPVERTGNDGFGETCSEAAQATGRSTTTSVLTRTHTLEVVGETYTDQPLSAEEPDEGKTGVSVVVETIVERGDVTIDSLLYEAGPNGEDMASVDQQPDQAQSSARYFGLAGGEYLVQIAPLDLWSPAEDLSLTLLTKRTPATGDIWASFDGSTLYIARGKEELNIGDSTYNADAVDVYSVEELDPEVSELIGSCLSVGAFQDVTEPDFSDNNVQTTQVILDPGCEGNFRHQQVGTEWWHKDILVQAERTTWSVSIDSFGYEWYEEENNGFCNRFTSVTAPVGQSALVFAQYTVTREVEEFEVSFTE